MLQNPLHKRFRLAGCHGEMTAGLLQGRQHLFHAGIQLVFINTGHRKTLPVFFHRTLSHLPLHPVKLHETVHQRRSNKYLKLVQIRLLDSHLMQRILNATGDARLGIGQRPVQIKQNILKHPSPPVCRRRRPSF